MRRALLLSSLIILSTSCVAFAARLAAALAPDLPPGGANAAPLSEPWPLVGDSVELPLGSGKVRIPAGSFVAPASGAANYSVPGPVIAIAGSDGVWRGHGYLETWTACTGFTAEHKKDASGWTATLTYSFQDDRTYVATLSSDGKRLRIDEQSQLGLRDIFVFDCYYHWQPTAGIAFSREAANQAYLYLPCHYDKAEATISTTTLLDAEQAGKAPAGVGVLSPKADSRTVLACWAIAPDSWQNGDRLGVQLWQRRQRAGDAGSRHFLGPETKSDGTPNPHTAKMMGQSSWEGHVTIEARLGTGSRSLGFALLERPDRLDELPALLQEAIRE